MVPPAPLTLDGQSLSGASAERPPGPAPGASHTAVTKWRSEECTQDGTDGTETQGLPNVIEGEQTIAIRLTANANELNVRRIADGHRKKKRQPTI